MLLLGVFDLVRYFKCVINHPRCWTLALGVLLPSAGAIAAPLQLKQQQPKDSNGLKVQQTITVKQDHLKVQLKSCVKAKPNVVCTLFLSSSKDDVIVWASDPNRGKSRLVDLDGNEYTTFEVNQFGRPETGTLLVSKAPVKLILSFTKLPQNLSSVALMEIGLETYGHEIPVRFRKVNFLTASPGVPVLPPKPIEKVPPAPEQPPAEVPPEPTPPDTEQPPAEAPPEQPPPDTEQPQPEAPVEPPAEAEPPADPKQSPTNTEPSADSEPPSTDKPQSPAGSKKTPTDSQQVPEVEQDTPGETQQDTTGTEPETQQDSTQPDASDSVDGASPEESQEPKIPPTSVPKSPETSK